MTFKNYCKEHIGMVCACILISLQISAFMTAGVYLLCKQMNTYENTSLIISVSALIATFILCTLTFISVNYLVNRNLSALDTVTSMKSAKKVTKERWKLKSITIKSNKRTITYDHDDITLSSCFGGMIGLVSIGFSAYAGRALPTNVHIFMILSVFIIVTIVSTLFLLFGMPLIAENIYSKDKEESEDKRGGH